MADHYAHTVAWCSDEGMAYRLYCFTCNEYTQYRMQNPPTLAQVTFEEAMAEPKGVNVTLDVQPLKHKKVLLFRR